MGITGDCSGVRRCHDQTVRQAVGLTLGVEVFEDEINGPRLEDFYSVVSAVVQDHLTHYSQVGGSGEDSSVSRHPVERPRVFVMNTAIHVN
jgi:hypothetical protein